MKATRFIFSLFRARRDVFDHDAGLDDDVSQFRRRRGRARGGS
jgi:hypothetical protein